MVSFRRKKNVNVIRVGVKIIATVIGLYASGIMLRVMGDLLINSSSPYYTGLKLVGWTVGNQVSNGTAGWFFACKEGASTPVQTVTTANCVTDTNGTGILAVVGLLAVVWIVFEFVDFSM